MAYFNPLNEYMGVLPTVAGCRQLRTRVTASSYIELLNFAESIVADWYPGVVDGADFVDVAAAVIYVPALPGRPHGGTDGCNM
jgi:hypothetical protein